MKYALPSFGKEKKNKIIPNEGFLIYPPCPIPIDEIGDWGGRGQITKKGSTNGGVNQVLSHPELFL